MKTSKNSKGFTAIEGLLIVIAVTLIGFVGYYVYHSQKQTDKTLNTATQTSNNTPAVSSKTKTSTNSNAGYFVINGWGVRAKYSGSLTLQYTPDSTVLGVMDFNSSQLKAADPSNCSDPNAGGIVARYAPTDQVYGDDGSSLGTAEQYFASYNNSSSGNNYSKVGNYYYQYQHPQSACSGNDQATALQQQTEDAVNTVVKDLVAAPAQ